LQEIYAAEETEATSLPTAPAFNLAEYLQALRSRWPLIVAVLLLCLSAGVAHYMLTPKLYRTRGQLQIQQSNLLGMSSSLNPYFEMWAGRMYYPTQYRLLRSRGLAERVVMDLRLMDDPSFNPAARSRSEPIEEISEERLAALAARLLSGLSVSPIEGTELVDISYVSKHPELAARIINGLARAYIDWGIETRTESVGKASTFIDEQIEAFKSQIEDKERELREYGRETDIVNLDSESSLALGQLSQLNDAYSAATSNRIRKEATHREFNSSADEVVADESTNPLLIQLRREVAQLEREYQNKLRIYKPDWPEMVELRGRLEEARQSLIDVESEEAEKIRRKALSDFQAASRQEADLKRRVDVAREEVFEESSAGVRLENLRMEIRNLRALLDDLLERQSEVGMSARLQTTRESNVRVVERALVPKSPFRPSLRNDLSMGLASGLILGFGLALLLHLLDRTIKSGEELERVLDLPVLSVVPDVSAGGRGYRSYNYYSYYGRGDREGETASGSRSRRRGEPDQPLDIELLPHSRPRLAVSEAYRSLRTALLLSSAEKLQVVAVTSAEASEGKTATAANLALVMAQLGRRVLLVDADLRKPRLHKVFEASNRSGLVTFLTGDSSSELSCIPTGLPNMSLCTSGPHPPNPSELLSSERMAEFLTMARAQFDFVVVDTPPVLAVTDAIIVGAQVQGLVLCCRAHKLMREDARTCVERLKLAGVRVLGAVLNRYRPSRSGSYDRRYYYYQSYEDSAETEAGSAA
jgi:capsular exopolysaccharide synthesis family protein